MKTAGIVGAGIIGRLLAFELITKGWQVSLFDQDSMAGKSSCSYAAAGMLAPYAELETTANIILSNGLKAIELWENILTKLNTSIVLQKTGSLLLAHPQDLPELFHIEQRLKSKLNHTAGIQMLQADAVASLEPELAHWHKHALYLSGDAHVDNRRLLNVMLDTLLENGLVFKANTLVNNLQAGLISTNTDNFNFDLVCDCRGLGAKANFPDLRGVRGELIYLHAPQVNISRALRLIHPRYRIYIVPRENNTYIIGSSEIESEDFSTISVQSTLELLSAAYSVHPGFAEARIIETSVHCRPAFADNLPQVYYADGLVRINGLYRHGFLLAPVVVANALQLIE